MKKCIETFIDIGELLNLKHMSKIREIKNKIKKFLVSQGITNPALGTKISSQEKATIILEYKKPEFNIFVETGTEYGAMIEMVGAKFKKIYSIEYDKDLYNNALKKFSNRDDIVFIHGDSGVELKKVVDELSEPALFWLDAHGTGAMTVRNPLHCPVEKELLAIFSRNILGHVIIIDDVRHFDRYTIGVIKNLAKKHGYTTTVRDGLFILK